MNKILKVNLINKVVNHLKDQRIPKLYQLINSWIIKMV
jgi:hypothetical protein